MKSRKKPKLAISSVRVRNFKAIRDSGWIEFEPLTVFIGDNGAGKSSLIEALETWRYIATSGLNDALTPWLSFESVWNKAAQEAKNPDAKMNKLQFEIRGLWRESEFEAQTLISKRENSLEISITTEKVLITDNAKNKRSLVRSSSVVNSYEQIIDYPSRKEGSTTVKPRSEISVIPAALGDRSLIGVEPVGFVANWHFASVIPQLMGIPTPQKRTYGSVALSKNGSNIADYLRDIVRLDFENKTNLHAGIVETMREVLPYASDLKPVSTDEIQRSLYIGLAESNFQVEGWMLSTGTMRVLSILALLRHPEPPAVIFIEELEGGLAPRTLTMIAREICEAVKTGKTQVIISTQSPYLLDLLALEQIIVVEREGNGQPSFTRPATQAWLKKWGSQFTPGQLYAAGLIRGGETADVEFKIAAILDPQTNTRNPEMIDNIIKGVVSFWNSYNGGTLIIGVDNKANVVGLSKAEYSAANKQRADTDSYELWIRGKIETSTRAEDVMELLDFRFETLNGKEVCVIQINPSHRAIYWNDELYVRSGNKSQKLKTRAALSYIEKRWSN
jgi:predicted ATPase